MNLIYRFGKYMYKNRSVYEKIWWIFYKKIIPGPFSYRQGVIKINELNGIVEELPDYSSLIPLDPERLTNDLKGEFLVNFKKSDVFFGNDPLPAKINPYRGHLNVKWENGMFAATHITNLNVWELKVDDTASNKKEVNSK